MTGPHVMRALAFTLGVVAAGIAGGETPGPTCVDGHLDATVTLRYDHRTLGEVAGLFLQVAYPDGVSLPGVGTDASVRDRITSLVDPKFRVAPVDEDTDGDGRDDRVRMLVVATTKDALPSAPIARIRFDCGKQPAIDSFRCTTDQVADAAGQLIREKEAKQVVCDVGFSPPADPKPAAR